MSEGGSLRVLHTIPGRLRVKLDSGNGSPDELYKWERRFRELPGVNQVEINRATGSILVRYDPAGISPQHQLGVMDSSGNPVVDSPPDDGRPEVAPSSLAARAAASALWKADAALSELTGGTVDLKIAIPAALLGAGILEVVAGAELAGMSFHVLAWYAYNLFYQFHPREMQYR